MTDEVLTAEERELTEAARGWCFLNRDKLVAIIDRLDAEVSRLTAERDYVRAALQRLADLAGRRHDRS